MKRVSCYLKSDVLETRDIDKLQKNTNLKLHRLSFRKSYTLALRFMSFLLNALCTKTEYTQNKARIRNYTLYIVDCFQLRQKESVLHDHDLTFCII